eukprot:NODE_2629_length_902_cov_284.956316.p1 GENE.NODE_2629_length_902_cov_284.956316~~NODE_2629_length_902_cov_284.956316.p1  ORF type:complete len:246 (-),score=60.74 NODE_2629_length_902_cov_284.956316:84-821(-)
MTTAEAAPLADQAEPASDSGAPARGSAGELSGHVAAMQPGADEGLQQRCSAEGRGEPQEQLTSLAQAGAAPPCTTARVRRACALLFLVLVLELALKWAAWHGDHAQRTLIDLGVLGLRLSWTYSENHASGLGFLSSLPAASRTAIYCGIALLGVVAVAWASRPGRDAALRLGIACYVFGGIGNFVDRALISCVVDFLEVQLLWPHWRLAFNLSDLLIDAGLVILTWRIFRGADTSGAKTAGFHEE